MATLGRELDAKRKATKHNQFTDSIAELPFYSAILQALVIPIFQTKKDNYDPLLVSIPLQKNSIAVDDTIYITKDTLLVFKDKLQIRITIMRQIPKEQLFSLLADQVDQVVLKPDLINPMTDLKGLIDHMSYICMNNIKKSGQGSPAELDEYFKKSLDMLISILREALLAEVGVSPEVRNHRLLGSNPLKSIISKYFLTTSQILQDGDGDMLVGVRNAFFISPGVHQLKVKKCMEGFNEGSVYADIQEYSTQLFRGDCPGYQRLDFGNSKGYSVFKKTEVAKLNQILKVMEEQYPKAKELAKDATIGKNMPSTSSEAEKYYRLLLQNLLNEDIKQSDGKILISKLSKSILNECAIRWRISAKFKDIALFDCQVKQYKAGKGISLKELYETYEVVRKISASYASCRKCEQNVLVGAYLTLNGLLLDQLKSLPNQVYRKGITPEDCDELLTLCGKLLKSFQVDPLCVFVEKFPTMTNEALETIMSDCIAESLNERVDKKIMPKLFEAFPNQNDIPNRIIDLLTLFVKDIRKFKEVFKSPLVEKVFVHYLAAKRYILSADHILQGINELPIDTDIHKVLEICRIAQEFYKICHEMNIKPAKDPEVVFVPIVHSFLMQANAQWLEWVKKGVKKDELNNYRFADPPSQLNSPCIMEIFKSFREQVLLIKSFAFKDYSLRETVRRGLAMRDSIETFCTLNYEEFKSFNNDRDENLKLFTRTQIIKMNNMFYCQKMFDELLELFEIESSDYESVSPLAEKVEIDSMPVFEIKILGAEGLGTTILPEPDSYPVIMIENDAISTGTKISYCNDHPMWNWEYTYRVSEDTLITTSKLGFMVMHENALGNDSPIGAGLLDILDPVFKSYLTYNVTLPLEPNGEIFLRIRRVGEIADTNWHLQRVQELIRCNLTDIVDTFIKTIQLFVEKGVTCVLLATNPTPFSLFKSEDVTDVKVVEKYFEPVLVFMDETLQLFDQNTDRRFDEYLRNLYPNIGERENGKSMSLVDTMVNDDGKPALIQPVLQPGWTKIKRLQYSSYRMGMMPDIVELFWHKILQLFYSMVQKASEDLTDENNKRRINVIQCVIELLKELFQCKVGSVVCGISTSRLHTSMYQQIQSEFDRIFNKYTTF
ncbi:hypothetical protein BC833DRAFT_616943 [Globomyces pollinis-pini]|nr:hypothetical protein BC833DRAFT_616943 [Globomyces pollinis-pini]